MVAYATADATAQLLGVTVELWPEGFALQARSPLAPGVQLNGAISSADGQRQVLFSAQVRSIARSGEAELALDVITADYRALLASLAPSARSAR